MPLVNHPASLTGSLLSAGLCIGAISWFGYIGPGELAAPKSRPDTAITAAPPARTPPPFDLRRTPPQDTPLTMPALSAAPAAPATADASPPVAQTPPAPPPPAPALRAAAPAPSQAPVPAPAPAPAGVRAQIGAVDSVEMAQAQWRKLAAKLPAQFAGKTHTGEWVDTPNARLYRSQVTGFASKEEARAFCSAARAVGQACFVN